MNSPVRVTLRQQMTDRAVQRQLMETIPDFVMRSQSLDNSCEAECHQRVYACRSDSSSTPSPEAMRFTKFI